MARKILVGERVYHDFSGIHGEVLAYRQDSQGYNYQVKWYDGKKTVDWYKRKVLRVL
jgi:hypothetical protein